MQIGDQVNPFSAKTVVGNGKINIDSTADKIVFSKQVKSILISSLPENDYRIYIGTIGLLSTGENAFCYLDPGDDVKLNYDSEGEDLYMVSESGTQVVIIGGLL